jgi:hypothetical protein
MISVQKKKVTQNFQRLRSSSYEIYPEAKTHIFTFGGLVMELFQVFRL